MQPNAPSSIPSIPIPVQSPHATNEPHRHPRINRQILALGRPHLRTAHRRTRVRAHRHAIVGHIGDTALAGLSIGSTILLTVVGLCVFLAYSTTSQVGHLIGAGRRREGLEAGSTGCGWPSSSAPWRHWSSSWPPNRCAGAMGARGDVLDNATAYLQAVVFGMPGMMLVYAANRHLPRLQKVRITLAAAVCGAVVNTVLDVLFVFGFDWGVTGSGVATLIAQWFMGCSWSCRRCCGRGRTARTGGHGCAASSAAPATVPCCSFRSLALRACMVATVMAATSMARRCWRPINR